MKARQVEVHACGGKGLPNDEVDTDEAGRVSGGRIAEFPRDLTHRASSTIESATERTTT